MDPTATLQEIRTLAHRRNEGVNGAHIDPERDADRLAELVDALDTWMSRGGFLPEPWAKAHASAGRWIAPRR